MKNVKNGKSRKMFLSHNPGWENVIQSKKNIHLQTLLTILKYKSYLNHKTKPSPHQEQQKSRKKQNKKKKEFT